MQTDFIFFFFLAIAAVFGALAFWARRRAMAESADRTVKPQ